MPELSPRKCAGWLQTCLSLESVPSIIPLPLDAFGRVQGLFSVSLRTEAVQGGLLLCQRAEDIHLHLLWAGLR